MQADFSVNSTAYATGTATHRLMYIEMGFNKKHRINSWFALSKIELFVTDYNILLQIISQFGYYENS